MSVYRSKIRAVVFLHRVVVLLDTFPIIRRGRTKLYPMMTMPTAYIVRIVETLMRGLVELGVDINREI